MLILREDFKKHFAAGNNLFAKLMAIKGKIFRKTKDRQTLRFVVAAKAYFIKKHFGVGWLEIFKNLLHFRLPIIGAKTEWLAIKKFEEINIPTMKIVGYGQRHFNPASRESFIITEELQNIVGLKDIADNWQKNPLSFYLKKKIIAEIARIARNMHGNGVNHRDFYLCHFQLDKKFLNPQSSTHSPQLYVIDLHRAQIRKKVPERWVIKDIAGLYFSSMGIVLTRGDIFRFLTCYYAEDWRKALKQHELFLRKVKMCALKLWVKHQ
jgi:heptose I phosphotransferase